MTYCKLTRDNWFARTVEPTYWVEDEYGEKIYPIRPYNSIQTDAPTFVPAKWDFVEKRWRCPDTEPCEWEDGTWVWGDDRDDD